MPLSTNPVTVLLVVAVTTSSSVQLATADRSADQVRRETTTTRLIDVLINNSDSRVRPNVYGAPITVMCSLFVQRIGPLSALDMEFEMEIFYLMEWVDSRLAFSTLTNESRPVILIGNVMDQIWIPDVYFANAKSSEMHDVLTSNRRGFVFPNGAVSYSVRLSLRLNCPMFLQRYPMDDPACPLKASSYSYSTADLILRWAEDKPIDKNNQLILPDFVLKDQTHNDSCTLTYAVGEYSCLIVKFHLQRQVTYYILRDYVVSALIVIIAWMSFWIHRDAVPARITLGVTTLLTMTTQLGNSSTGTAVVSYLKAIDIWNAFCMIMVFVALMEFAVVNVLARRETAARAEARQGRTAGASTAEKIPSAGVGDVF